jgi:hypothetical protein
MIMLLPLPLRKLWLGQQPLSRAFWFYGFFLECLLFLVLTLALQPLSVNQEGLAIGLRAVISWPYTILAWVGIWRSANVYSGKKHWAAIAAKVAVCFFALAMIGGFIRNGGFTHLFELLMGSN